MRKKPPVLKKERGRFFEHGFEHGRERERRRKVAQRVFAAAGNRRAETDGGAPTVSESAAPKRRTERSESAAGKAAQRVVGAAGRSRGGPEESGRADA